MTERYATARGRGVWFTIRVGGPGLVVAWQKANVAASRVNPQVRRWQRHRSWDGPGQRPVGEGGHNSRGDGSGRVVAVLLLGPGQRGVAQNGTRGRAWQEINVDVGRVTP